MRRKVVARHHLETINGRVLAVGADGTVAMDEVEASAMKRGGGGEWRDEPALAHPSGH